MSCIFPKILAGRKGIKSPLIIADALFWWGMYLSPWAPLVLPGARETEVKIQVKLIQVEEPNRIGFPGGDFNLNDRKTWNTLMSRLQV